MENSLTQGKGVPFRQPNIFQKRILQPFSEVKQFAKNIQSNQSSLLNKQNVNTAVNNTVRKNVQNMNRVYAERKAKLDDKKFWEDKNRREYEQSQAALRKQKAERDQASSEYFNKLGDLYNKIANSDNSTILDKISAPATVVDKFILDTASRFFGNAIDGNAEEKMSKASFNNDKIRMAEAHNKVKEYDRMLQDINRQRSMYSKLLNDPKSDKQVVNEYLQQLNADSQDIFNKKKEAEQLDNIYKANYVNDNKGILCFESLDHLYKLQQHYRQFRNYLLQSYNIAVSLICFVYLLILLLLHLDFSILGV